MSDLTANQHYVWQHYLRAWGAPRKIWCKRADQPEPFQTTPRNVGAQRFFYEFHELTPDDLAYLHQVISKSNDAKLRDLNRGWIDSFQMTFSIRDRLKSFEIEPALREELETTLREIERTLGERFHGATEDRGLPLIDALRLGDTSFYAEEAGWMGFIDYITHQYFRTAKLRNAMLAIENPLPHDMRRTWPIEAFIYATNLASSLVRQRRDYRIVLLRNLSAIPFITGDQPVINLLGIEVEELDIYYPLQPDLAMIFTSSKARYPLDRVDVGQISVESYNHRIYGKSDTQIYGNDPTYLKALTQLPKEVRFT